MIGRKETFALWCSIVRMEIGDIKDCEAHQDKCDDGGFKFLH